MHTSVLPVKTETQLVLPAEYRVRRALPATALGIALALTVAFAPAAAKAQCRQWDASGSWTIIQAGGIEIAVSLRQNGKVITGTAERTLSGKGSSSVMGSFGTEGVDKGSIDGTVDGDNCNFQLYWLHGVVGVYSAKIGPQGRLEGRAYDKNKPSNNATWFSSRVMRCNEAKPGSSGVNSGYQLPPPPAPTPRPGKPVGKTGKMTLPAAPPNTTGAPAQAPKITARPSLVIIPAGETQGTTTVTWDGGPDHPYAELWVKEGDADERFVAEQGKGSRTMTVKPGTSYLFILTDNGKRLDTANVKVRP